MLRFGNENRICTIATLEAGERTVAGALFFDHTLNNDVGCWRETPALNCIESGQTCH